MSERDSEARGIQRLPHCRRWFPLVTALVANSLLFCSLAAVRREPSLEGVQAMDAVRVLAIDLPDTESPLPEAHQAEPVLPTVAGQRSPAPAVPIAVQPLHRLAPRLPESINALSAELPGLPITLPGSADLMALSETLASTPEEPFTESQVDRVPVKVAGGQPQYPSWARRARLEATVTVRFVITGEGKVENVRIHGIEGDERFGDEAAKAIATWRFEPAMKNDKPVAYWYFQKVYFQLVR